jgi:hypothetical protein
VIVLPLEKQEKAELEPAFFCNTLMYWKAGEKIHISSSTTEENCMLRSRESQKMNSARCYPLCPRGFTKEFSSSRTLQFSVIIQIQKSLTTQSNESIA